MNFFFEKEKKKLIIFWTSLSKLETLSIFQLSSKNTYLVEENFLCCYFFFKNFLPYKKQNLSTTFKAFSVCSPSHTFYEKAQYFSAIFSAIFENFGAHYSSTFYCPPSIYNLFTLIAPEPVLEKKKFLLQLLLLHTTIFFWKKRNEILFPFIYTTQ